MSRIMIVDDSLIVRINLKKLLEDAGHEVVAECDNGRDALAKYKAERPDIVTMDITMPSMDGMSALKEIMGHDPAAKVIMITALGQSNKVLDALNAGATNYVVKPFDADRVLAAVKAAEAME